MSQEKSILPGDTALQLVKGLPAQFPHVQDYTFIQYRVTPGLGARISTKPEGEGGGLVKEYPDFSNWFTEETIATSNTAELLKELLVHDGRTEQKGRFKLTKGDLQNGGLEKRISTLGGQDVIGLCSRCRTRDRETLHIPILDFNVSPCDVAEKLVSDAMRLLLNCDGYILGSGKSYHYYGMTLLRWRRYSDFLSKSLLLTPLTDIRYIAHRLISRIGVLRITSNSAKPNEPIVLRRLDQKK